MSQVQQFKLMADYNRWMNENLYGAASALSADQLAEDRGAFFGSLLGTFNHLMVGDTVWLRRFARHPSQFPSLQYLLDIPPPRALDQILYEDFHSLRQARRSMDDAILSFVNETRESDYEQILAYQNVKGSSFRKPFGALVQHFFNHQTHHRGQVTALLSQLGIDYGTTDLLVRISEAS